MGACGGGGGCDGGRSETKTNQRKKKKGRCVGFGIGTYIDEKVGEDEAVVKYVQDTIRDESSGSIAFEFVLVGDGLRHPRIRSQCAVSGCVPLSKRQKPPIHPIDEGEDREHRQKQTTPRKKETVSNGFSKKKGKRGGQ